MSTKRCRSCGGTQSVLGETCFECDSHPRLHAPYGRLNARCHLCLADFWAALPRSISVCAWRAVAMLRRSVTRP